MHVVAEFPKNPVFVTFGHMDTFGQEPAEYLERIAELSNLIAPDMVLVSNEVNGAYVSGALSRLICRTSSTSATTKSQVTKSGMATLST